MSFHLSAAGGKCQSPEQEAGVQQRSEDACEINCPYMYALASNCKNFTKFWDRFITEDEVFTLNKGVVKKGQVLFYSSMQWQEENARAQSGTWKRSS